MRYLCQPDLFSLPERRPAPNPVRDELVRLNQNQTNALSYLERHRGEWISTWTLIVDANAGSRVPARLWELQQKGYPVERRHVQAGKWEWRLKIVS